MSEVVKDFCNGSDLLIKIGDKAIGHCTSDSIKFSTETKERAFKPPFSAAPSSSLWKGKGVVGMSIGIEGSGLVYLGEAENGYAELAKLWKAGVSVEVSAYVRGETDPYLKGKFVITDLSREGASQDDATYSISLENDGEPETFDYTKFQMVQAASEGGEG